MGQLVNAVLWGFGATLGEYVANAAVGDAKEWLRYLCLIGGEIGGSERDVRVGWGLK